MEEEWELLELTGPSRSSIIHPPTDRLVQSLGSIITIWDIHTDNKINLRCHDAPIGAITLSHDNEFLITIDQALQPMICVWRWKNFGQEVVKWAPFKPRRASPQVKCCMGQRMLAVFENEADGGYRLSLWEWRAPDLILIQTEDLEQRNSLIAGYFLSDNLTLMTAEKNCLKLWKLDNPISIGKRLHLKTDVIDVKYASNVSLFVILFATGVVMTVTHTGRTLQQLIHPSSSFTAVGLFQDYIYCGTREGSVSIYTIRTNRLFREIPSMHSSPIEKLFVNGGNLIYAEFNDATVQISNVTQGKVVNQNSGHTAKINSVRWFQRFNFLTSADEEYLYVWKQAGKGWELQALDVSNGKGNISALAVHPKRAFIACGFSRGCVKVFELSERTRILTTSQLSVMKVTFLEFTPSGHYLAVSYETGQVVLLGQYYNTPLLSLSAQWGTGIDQQTSFIESQTGQTGYWLKAANLSAPDSVEVHMFRVEGDVIPTSNFVLYVKGRCTGFAFHISGEYLLATSDAGGIYLFSVESGQSIGIIEVEQQAIGCVLDQSGLYVGIVLPSKERKYSRFQLYEIGTARRASELSRLENCSLTNAISFSNDGRFIIIGGDNGVLSVWKLPASIVNNMYNMLENLQKNPEYWMMFPITLPKREIEIPPDTVQQNSIRKVTEAPVVENFRRGSGGFADSVVSFVKRPQQSLRQTEQFYTGQGKDVVSFTQQYAPVGQLTQQPITDPNFRTRNVKTLQPRVPRQDQTMMRSQIPTLNLGSQQMNAPVVMKMNRRYPEPDNIDIECEEPILYPASRLYELSDKNESGHEVENAYKEMDMFPY